MKTQITPDETIDMTPEEKHAMNKYEQAIAEGDNICQGILKETEENETMILKAEKLLDPPPQKNLTSYWHCPNQMCQHRQNRQQT